MEEELKPGLRGEVSFVVRPEHLAPALGSGKARVFATPMLVAGIEAAACAITQPRLPEAETTVGVHVDIRHTAASPLGMKVTFEATLAAVSEDGRRLYFKVRASDEAGEIGGGEHERVIVNRQKFESRSSARKRE